MRKGIVKVGAVLAGCLALCLALSLAAFAGSPKVPPAPKAPLIVNVTDVGGSLAFMQEMFDKYLRDYPQFVSRFAFTQAPAPELPGKIRAMQDAGKSDIDLVLGGMDALAGGIEFDLWEKLFPDFEEYFPAVFDSLLDPVKVVQNLGKGYGMVSGFMYNGPFLTYNPKTMKTPPPTTPQELLEWAKAHPHRFIYARPNNSGPGRAFLAGLPYLLGDKDPRDPVKGWDKTWAYLEELNKYVEYYPAGTGAVMKEVGEGSRDMTVTTTGWDINPRALGVVPKEFKIQFFKNNVFLGDCNYMMVPKKLNEERRAIVMHLINYLLQPEQQAFAWDKGYFYPGPAVKGVTLDMAPPASQELIKEFGRKEYETIPQDYKFVPPLEAKQLIDAFKVWDERVGAKVGQK